MARTSRKGSEPGLQAFNLYLAHLCNILSESRQTRDISYPTFGREVLTVDEFLPLVGREGNAGASTAAS